MRRILVAGASGYLGHHLVRAAHRRGYRVRALTRSARKVESVRGLIDDVVVAQATRAATLAGIAQDVDVVVSAVGITRQREGCTYEDVDYRANLNLLDEALRARVRRFAYVSVLDAAAMRGLRVVDAKERFVEALRRSGVDHVVVRPNGYFSDMRAFLDMARRGRVYVFGEGRFRINPIDGADAAEVCLDAVDAPAREVACGGPDTLTHRSIAQAAFAALGAPPRITSVPVWVPRAARAMMRALTPSTVYGPLEFALAILTRDMIGPPRGRERLADFFAREAASRS